MVIEEEVKDKAEESVKLSLVEITFLDGSTDTYAMYLSSDLDLYDLFFKDPSRYHKLRRVYDTTVDCFKCKSILKVSLPSEI